MLPVLPHWAPLEEEAECQSRHIPSAWGFPAGRVFSWPCWGWNVQMYQGEAQQCLGAVQGKCIWCHTRLPSSTTGTGTGVELHHCRVRLLTRQTPFLGLQRSQGQHTPAQPPQEVISQEKAACGGGFVAGDQSPWQLPRFPVFGCCTARLCSWVCVPGRGRRRQGGGAQALRGEEGSAVPEVGCRAQPSCLSLGNTEMGLKPHGHPWERQVGGRDAWERG